MLGVIMISVVMTNDTVLSVVVPCAQFSISSLDQMSLHHLKKLVSTSLEAFTLILKNDYWYMVS
jgi:hypothetical protein